MKLTDAIDFVIKKDDKYVFDLAITMEFIGKAYESKEFDNKGCLMGFNDDEKIIIHPPTIGTGSRFYSGKWNNKTIKSDQIIDSI